MLRKIRSISKCG